MNTLAAVSLISSIYSAPSCLYSGFPIAFSMKCLIYAFLAMCENASGLSISMLIICMTINSSSYYWIVDTSPAKSMQIPKMVGTITGSRVYCKNFFDENKTRSRIIKFLYCNLFVVLITRFKIAVKFLVDSSCCRI